MTDFADNYLQDLGLLLRERLADAESAYNAAAPEQKQYEAGRYRAYREVLNLMILQAEAFDLPLSAVRLEGIDREKDLGC
ncbi:hypothetical protein [Aquimonas voraii]|uniref:Uncharacterized protein n=1 Tax=Aquimonas voraii TaxID=265719 RepID=A0A1G7AIH9_9GAMM|nr:hypothetical protein [Aquimonas voraii]SDE14734.1 hypothetical protein SAMN04488509_1292 [Aquimonas voraii]